MHRIIVALAIFAAVALGIGATAGEASASPESLWCGRWRCHATAPYWGYWQATVVPTSFVSYGYWYPQAAWPVAPAWYGPSYWWP